MAILQFGGIITKASGRIGGQTIGNNKGGSFLKNTGTYKKSLSVKRQTVLSLFQVTSQRWRTLTDMQRVAWNAATVNFPYINRLGITRFYSGYQLFVMINGNLEQAGLPFRSSPPINEGFTPIPIPTIASPAQNIIITNSVGAKPAAVYLFYFSIGVSSGNTSLSRNYKFVAQLTNSQLNSPYDALPEYIAVYGEPPVNSRIFWYCDAINVNQGNRLEKLASGSFIMS